MPGNRRFWIGVVLAGVGVALGPGSLARADDEPAELLSPDPPDLPLDPEAELEAVSVSEPEWTESPTWEQAPAETNLPEGEVEEDETEAVDEGPEGAEAEPAVDVPELDGPELEWPSAETPEPAAAPIPSDPAALRLFVESEPAALGPLSIGTPDGGLLFNPVAMPEGELWKIRNPRETFATAETIEFLKGAIAAVEARHPGSPPLVIGDMSRPDGGRLNRHRSHQAGRDADIGFYFRSGAAADFRRPGRNELDVPRTWTLVRAFVTQTDVERIFIDRALQRLLYAHALSEGEDPGWLDDIFGRRTAGKDAIIQHERRHQDHLHVRFYNPSAQERGRVAYPLLVEARLVPGPTVTHRVRRGETLSHLARRYGASVKAIRAANGLRGSAIRAGRSYVIPVRKAPVLADPVAVPPRRLPPELQVQDEARPTDSGGSLP